MLPRTRLRLGVAALLAFSLMTGLAQVFLLPPWEGFDEPAHFSYIQQLAETHRWPQRGDGLAAAFDEYAKLAPMPYDLPFGHVSYYGFFGGSPDAIEAVRKAIHSPGRNPRGWRSGSIPNWEAQHPPLYYLLLAPLYGISRDWSLLHQLTLLRAVSYGIAWLALCMVAIAGSDFETAGSLAPALWPYLFPMWFPEMARLGNDSLVAFLAASAWLACRRVLARKDRSPDYAVLGLVCGLGLLTKATFFPFTAVLCGFFAWRVWGVRRDGMQAQKRLLGLVSMLGILAVTAGWWYFGQFHKTGNLFGANDIINMDRTGGLGAILHKPGAVALIVYGLVQIGISFLWSGTWSYVEPPPVALLPLLAIALITGIAHLAWLKKRAPGITWIPLVTLMVFLAGLCYSVLVFIVAYGVGGTGGWYLHSFAPVLCLMLGTGLMTLGRSRRLRLPLLCLLLYPAVFLPGAAFYEAFTYAGCGRKIGSWLPLGSLGLDGVYSPLTCIANPSWIMKNLGVLGSPHAAVLFFSIGWMALIAALVLLSRDGGFVWKSDN
jgi:hypothetical protein